MNFNVAGVQFHKLKTVHTDINEGMQLDLVPEPENEYDPNAVAIKFNDTMLGYVPKKFSAEVAAILETTGASCKVTKLDMAMKPWEQLEVEIVMEDSE